jgi:hypothetical protein
MILMMTTTTMVMMMMITMMMLMTQLTTTAYCGSCDTPCPPPNTNVDFSECLGGACVIRSCLDTFGNCNGNAADGCETNLVGGSGPSAFVGVYRAWSAIVALVIIIVIMDSSSSSS